jgi:hypothetical protein
MNAVASVTRSTAGLAQAGSTRLALLRAGTAQPSLAAGARFETIEAQVPVATFAKRPVVLSDKAAAISAGSAFPVGERAIRAVAVIGIEDLGHDLEKIGQSTGEQGAANRLLSIALAERLVPHMGMGDVARLRRGIWAQSDDVVAPMPTDPLPMQADHKGPEIEVFQYDAVGRHRHGLASQVESEPVEFSRQGT